MIAAIKEECQRLKRQTDEENTVQLKGDLVSLRATLQEREKDIEDYNQSITQLRHRLEESASTSIDDRVKAAEIAEAELLQKLESMNDQANNNQKEIKSLESKLRNTMSQLLQAQQQLRRPAIVMCTPSQAQSPTSLAQSTSIIAMTIWASQSMIMRCYQQCSTFLTRSRSCSR